MGSTGLRFCCVVNYVACCGCYFISSSLGPGSAGCSPSRCRNQIAARRGKPRRVELAAPRRCSPLGGMNLSYEWSATFTGNRKFLTPFERSEVGTGIGVGAVCGVQGWLNIHTFCLGPGRVIYAHALRLIVMGISSVIGRGGRERGSKAESWIGRVFFGGPPAACLADCWWVMLYYLLCWIAPPRPWRTHASALIVIERYK